VDQLENLRTIAEIAAAFAGFTGVVIALGQRAAGRWLPAEKSTIRILLETSIGTVFFAMLPAILGTTIQNPTTTWRTCAGLLTVYHVAILFRSDVLDRGQAGQLLGRRLDLIASGTGYISSCATAGVALGLLAEAAQLIYMLSLLWLLLVAALSFVGLLLASGRPSA